MCRFSLRCSISLFVWLMSQIAILDNFQCEISQLTVTWWTIFCSLLLNNNFQLFSNLFCGKCSRFSPLYSYIDTGHCVEMCEIRGGKVDIGSVVQNSKNYTSQYTGCHCSRYTLCITHTVTYLEHWRSGPVPNMCLLHLQEGPKETIWTRLCQWFARWTGRPI